MSYDLSIDLQAVAPVRGGSRVAEGVSVSLRPGGALILRGGNGSGKTSVLRAVAGLCRYEGGVRFARGGNAIDPAEARAADLHLLADGNGLVSRLTVTEHLAFWRDLYAAPDRRDEAAMDAGLSAILNSPAGTLSTGQKRRLGLARLRLARRAVWLLDEPMSGLDEAARAALTTAIADHRADGGIVLMATHEEGALPGAPTLRLSRVPA